MQRMRMLNRIKLWLYKFRMTQDDAWMGCVVSGTFQTDTRAHEMIKRIRKAFEQQQQAMNTRALKSHDPSCRDLLSCKKKHCFKREPDKIVSGPYEVKGRK